MGWTKHICILVIAGATECVYILISLRDW
jgi:hypothetical protein